MFGVFKLLQKLKKHLKRRRQIITRRLKQPLQQPRRQHQKRKTFYFKILGKKADQKQKIKEKAF